MTEDSAIQIDLQSIEVVHFTHTICIPIVWASSPHSSLCHNKYPIRAFHSSTLVRVPTLWSTSRHAPAVYLSSSSVTLAPRRENTSVFRMGSLLAGPLHCCPALATTQIPGSYKPLCSVRLPALKQTNFRISPVPYQGNVVARDKLVWRTLIHNALFHKSSSSFSPFSRTCFRENISVE
jgi:hypothetical protein